MKRGFLGIGKTFKFHQHLATLKFNLHRLLVHLLQKPISKNSVHLTGAPDDLFGDFIVPQ